MQLNSYVGFYKVILTLVLAMCLRIAPWPGAMAAFDPDWVLPGSYLLVTCDT